jgi:TusA-related sulfurtransferase
MANYTLDSLGLKCPQPILKVAVKAKELQPGEKTLLFCNTDGEKHTAQIQF